MTTSSSENRSDGPSGHLVCFIVSSHDSIFSSANSPRRGNGFLQFCCLRSPTLFLMKLILCGSFFFFCNEVVSEGGDEHPLKGVECPLWLHKERANFQKCQLTYNTTYNSGLVMFPLNGVKATISHRQEFRLLLFVHVYLLSRMVVFLPRYARRSNAASTPATKYQV